MTAGQGCPRGLPPPAHGSARLVAALRTVMTLALFLLASGSLAAQDEAAELDLELRLTIRSAAPQMWRGTIFVERGEAALVRRLGLEADTPGDTRQASGQIYLTQRSARVYDALDIAVRGARDAVLVVELAAEGEPKRVEIPLADVISGVHNSALAGDQSRLIVQRSPGDKLRLVMERDALVFDTGETFRFSVEPHEAGLPSDAALRCRVRLLGRGDEELWSTESDFRLDRSGIAPTLGPFDCVLPEVEGVYRVAIEIVQPPRLGVALVRSKPLVARDVQLVAISLTPPDEADATPFSTVIEIDPAHPHWLERLTRLTKLTSIPGFANKEPLDNGKSRVAPRNGTELVELAPSGWQAYPLPLKSPDWPHILEVECPADASQSLGISIVEPNAAGQVAPLGVDSGLTTVASPTPGVIKHRLVFWPRTKTPLVLLTNRHSKEPAIYGKLRVLSGPRHLPSSLPIAAERGRLVAAYYDKPLFAENFGVVEGVDGPSGRVLDDWNTFFLGARRLIEELKFAGYNGAIVSVACEGSALYPSSLLEPTPKYDMGVFFASAQDPVRKDVLEMLFRLFDREGLQLVPAIQFAAPLAELEELKLNSRDALGLELVGPDGKTYLAARGARRGVAPYYNPLDDRVRKAMRNVVEELAVRYAHHDSFAGVSLPLHPETYAQLPGEEWGYDDVTMARFARETKKQAPGAGATRYAQRARQLQGPDRAAWLAWRAKQVSSLYTTIERDLARRRGNAKLYLAGGEMLHSESLERALRPTLPSQARWRDALLSAGFDLELLRGSSNIVFLRPIREFAPSELAARGGQMEVNRATELDDLLERLGGSGAHLFYEPATLRLPEFDAASPFGADKTHLFLAAQLSPGGPRARRSFASALATFDAQSIVQGGWMLPLGQEHELREVLAVYRQLPPTRLAKIENDAPQAQPVIVRRGVHEGQTFVLLMNPSPWPAVVKLDLIDPDGAAWSALGTRLLAAPLRSGATQTFTIELAPFDLFALRSTSARAQVAAWQTTLPGEALAELRRDVDLLRAKAIALRGAPPLSTLVNADFERGAGTPPVGWVHHRAAGVEIGVDAVQPRGSFSLHMKSTKEDAWVRSDPIPAPTTGRLVVWVWLRTKDAAAQPPLRLAIEGQHRNTPYYRFASVGAGASSPPLKEQWEPFIFQVDDLPAGELTDLRVGFDLMGAGEVWIDDVQVFDQYFHPHEHDELLKLIALADLQLGRGHLGDCQRLLDGYWPRFLQEHVAPPRPRAEMPSVSAPAPAATPPASEAKNIRDKVWNWVPKWR